MHAHLVWGFTAAALVAYVVPGPDWFVVLRQASRSRAAGMCAAIGVQCGLIVHMTAAALGVSAILLTSAEAFTVVKLAGAAYLVALGARALRDGYRGWRRRHAERVPGVPSPTPATGSRVFAQAFIANVLNPKAALFFVAVLPQFLAPANPVIPQALLLGVLDIAIGCAWWLLFVVTATRFHSLLRRRRAQIAVDTLAGVALTGLGGALAFTDRARV
ncbi:LysE family translocator [Nocardia beijingensis]|uniref:LysE family translocator n=1 Tax=Nocardia beijingensis TaxID=95162 RepID=UPI0018934D03|nr:LysE family translocator [Nocardia beijingensis]MBF6468220.1 LysE family translocator [Nocardia beijingensis]